MWKRGKIFLIAGIIFLLLFSAIKIKNSFPTYFDDHSTVKYYSKISWNDQQGIYAADMIHPSTSLVGEKIIMFPKNYLKFNISETDFDFTPTETKSIYNNYLILEKQLNIFNPTQNVDTISIGKDSLGVVTFTTSFSHITNGPFTAYPDKERLAVRSHYNHMDVIPLRVIYEKENIILDKVEFKWEPNYPPYYISQYYKNKNIITEEDIVEILKSYSNLRGDYFEQNSKHLVCTDAITLPIKTVGIDYLGLIKKYNISGNRYLQRNSGIMYVLLKKLGLVDNYIHYFMEGDRSKIYEYGRYNNLIAENFGIDQLEPGQVMFYDRYFNTGPEAGSIQRFDIHSALITETSEGKITRAGMVTSRKTSPPYDTLIMLNSDVNFPAWFGYRQHYRGSDETNEELRYVVYAIMDLKSIIQRLRAINFESYKAASK